MATIRDVAKHAGVSISTVSYVLSGDRPVGPDARDRVMTAIDELGYRANSVARSLKTGRTMTLALLIPDILNPFFTLVACAIEDAAGGQGYSLILCNTSADPRREEKYLGLIHSRRVDGLIYMPGSSLSHKQLHALVRRKFPVVVIDESLRDIEAATVFVDNHEGAAQAARHLADLGHRRIGVIGGPPELSTVEARVAGFVQGLSEHGIEVPGACIAYGNYQLDGGRQAMRQLLDSGVNLTAVFAANDLMAVGAMQEAQARGLDVPLDISIVGFDDISLSALITPALTTVEQPAVQMGRLAVELLMDTFLERKQPPKHAVLGAELRIRASTGPVASAKRE